MAGKIFPYGTVVRDNLMIWVDAARTDSYNGTTTWYDLSGNGYNGTISGNPPYTKEAGGAYDFDDTDGKVLFTSLPNYSGYCYDFWFYNYNEISNATIGGPSTFQSLASWTKTNGSGEINFGNWTGNAYNETIHIWGYQAASPGYSMTHTISNDQTHPPGYQHLAFNWNGTKYDIWNNGTKLNSWSAAETNSTYGSGNSSMGHADLGTNGSTFRLCVNGSGGYYFYGKLFSFKLYNGQLTDSQVEQNYNALKGRFGL